MNFKLIDKITEEVWGKWISIPFAFLIFSIFGVILYASLSEKNKVAVLIILILMMGLFIWYSVFVFLKNHIKKAPKGKIGILVGYDAANYEVYKETKRKFGDVFSTNLFCDFNIISVPYEVINKINYRDKKSMIKILSKKRCILYLNIRIDYDGTGNEVLYEMCIKAVVMHRLYTKEVEKRYSKEIYDALKKFEEVTFNSKEMIKKLKVTAEEISLACEYIIGFSFFLNGEFDKAEKILFALLKIISNDSYWEKIVFFIQRIRYEMFMTQAAIKSNEYQNNCDEENLLDEYNNYLEKANNCKKGTYEYNMGKAYYCMAKNNDVKEAKKYVNICSQMKGVPQTWRYSVAFLKAYENKGISSIISSYKQALKIKYNIRDLIVYIESVYEKNPECYGLLLALGILYNARGDMILAKERLSLYINKSGNPDGVREYLIKKGFSSIID